MLSFYTMKKTYSSVLSCVLFIARCQLTELTFLTLGLSRFSSGVFFSIVGYKYQSIVSRLKTISYQIIDCDLIS